MAEESGSSKAIPSNEEIIEEVMQGVEGCLIKETIVEDLAENKIGHKLKDRAMYYNYKTDRNKHIVDLSKVSCKTIDVKESCEKEEDFIGAEIFKGAAGSLPREEKEVNKSCEEDDFIDEEVLKDAEGSLSQEEKELRRDEAEGHKGRGNECFKTGEYRSSIEHYTSGLRICPLGYSKERAILYANRAAAKMKLTLKESAIEDSTKAVELDPSYLKARYRRALLYEETEKYEDALTDYQEILKLDPLHREALYATKRLPEKMHERDEKMKAEMLSKLKELGNMILRPFNLSTDNFQMNQDPNTGGYSINFRSNSS